MTDEHLAARVGASLRACGTFQRQRLQSTPSRAPVAPASVKGGSTSLPPKPPCEKLPAPVAGRGALGGSRHTGVGQWVALTPALFHDQCLRDFQGGFVSFFFFFFYFSCVP